jgi:hypothetical protein
MSTYHLTLTVRQVVAIESALIVAISEAESRARESERYNMASSADTHRKEAERLTQLLADYREAAYEKATVE